MDVKTHGTFKATESEMIEDKTSAEGQAESFMLGLEPGQPSDPYGQPSDDENSAELSDSDMEAGSSKGGGKGGKGAGKNKGYASKRVPKADVHEERALEARPYFLHMRGNCQLVPL